MWFARWCRKFIDCERGVATPATTLIATFIGSLSVIGIIWSISAALRASTPPDLQNPQVAISDVLVGIQSESLQGFQCYNPSEAILVIECKGVNVFSVAPLLAAGEGESPWVAPPSSATVPHVSAIYDPACFYVRIDGQNGMQCLYASLARLDGSRVIADLVSEFIPRSDCAAGFYFPIRDDFPDNNVWPHTGNCDPPDDGTPRFGDDALENHERTGLVNVRLSGMVDCDGSMQHPRRVGGRLVGCNNDPVEHDDLVFLTWECETRLHIDPVPCSEMSWESLSRTRLTTDADWNAAWQTLAITGQEVTAVRLDWCHPPAKETATPECEPGFAQIPLSS